MCGSGTVGGSAVSSPWTARHISTAVMWWVGDSPRPTGTLSPSLPSYPSVTTTPPPPAGSSQCHCFAGGGQNLRAQPGHTPSPPKLSSPFLPPLMHTALTKLFLLFPSPPAPFGTQMGGGGGGSRGSDNWHTWGFAPGRAAAPVSPPSHLEPPHPGWEQQGLGMGGLGTVPLGGGYMTS